MIVNTEGSQTKYIKVLEGKCSLNTLMVFCVLTFGCILFFMVCKLTKMPDKVAHLGFLFGLICCCLGVFVYLVMLCFDVLMNESRTFCLSLIVLIRNLRSGRNEDNNLDNFVNCTKFDKYNWTDV